jgi:hypothetical protein
MKIEITQDQINNLFVFLDRIEIKGFKEIQALNEIIALFQQSENKGEDK